VDPACSARRAGFRFRLRFERWEPFAASDFEVERVDVRRRRVLFDLDEASGSVFAGVPEPAFAETAFAALAGRRRRRRRFAPPPPVGAAAPPKSSAIDRS
jgi:hypothetical protein